MLPRWRLPTAGVGAAAGPIPPTILGAGAWERERRRELKPSLNTWPGPRQQRRAFPRWLSTQLLDGVHEASLVPNMHDADCHEVPVRQERQDVLADAGGLEGRRVLLEAQVLEPGTQGERHARRAPLPFKARVAVRFLGRRS